MFCARSLSHASFPCTMPRLIAWFFKPAHRTGEFLRFAHFFLKSSNAMYFPKKSSFFPRFLRGICGGLYHFPCCGSCAVDGTRVYGSVVVPTHALVKGQRQKKPVDIGSCRWSQFDGRLKSAAESEWDGNQADSVGPSSYTVPVEWL